MAEEPFAARYKAIEEMEQRIPAGKYAVVGVDEFTWDPETELYLIAVYDTREEAEAARDDREAKDAGCEIPDSYYVYAGRGSPRPS